MTITPKTNKRHGTQNLLSWDAKVEKTKIPIKHIIERKYVPSKNIITFFLIFFFSGV
jgi:hypothetical protein